MTGLESLPVTFTTRAALRAGVHPRDLYRWRDEGDVTELSRGVFRHADAPQPSFPDLLAVGMRAPHAIVCCVSAAVAHGLTDEMEPAVQIAVSSGRHPVHIAYPPTTVFRFDAETFELGLTRMEVAPDEYTRIYDSARTVVDLMRLRHRLGEPLAHTVLNRYLASPGAKPGRVLEYANVLGAVGPVRLALDIAGAR